MKINAVYTVDMIKPEHRGVPVEQDNLEYIGKHTVDYHDEKEDNESTNIVLAYQNGKYVTFMCFPELNNSVGGSRIREYQGVKGSLIMHVQTILDSVNERGRNAGTALNVLDDFFLIVEKPSKTSRPAA